MKKILILTSFLFFECKNELICTINKDNLGKKVYDLDEATCYIALKMNKKKTDLHLIRNALVAEEKYMANIGLVFKKTISKSESKSIVELDINKMIEYVLKEEKVELTKAQLLKIYNTEIEYLKFIGLIDK